ncbi:MAG: type II secretion system GspH family protein [Butyrivibrio sp.]|nr:type II secretion system GspH family protein [Muribaculum sp.]MCM1552430.1 type II secretion system GspH family protein [Butyrivibrio sp.]
MNHKGMTLIEVLVAVTILGVVLVPTLHIFANTSTTNFRSRQRQRATSVAEGVMESMKAYSVKELCAQFSSDSFKGVEKAAPGAAAVTTMSVNTVDSSMTDITTPALHSDLTLNEDVYGYSFKINNAASEGMFFDVVATVLPKSSPTVMNMDSPNTFSDAIIMLPENMGSSAYAKIQDAAKTRLATDLGAATTHIVDNIDISNLTRTITLDVADNGLTQQVKVKISCKADAVLSYRYGVGLASSNTRSYTGSDAISIDVDLRDLAGTAVETLEWTAYDNTNTIGSASGSAIEVWNGSRQCKLNRIFLYYFPTYKETSGTGAKDVVNVTGSLTGLYDYMTSMGGAPITQGDSDAVGYYPLELYMVKQKPVYSSDMDVHLSDIAYDLTVSNTTTGSGVINLYTNAKDYIGHVTTIPAPTAPTPSVSGFGVVGNVEDGFVKRLDVLYDVNIHVYEAGTTREVANFIGTMNE